MTSPDTSESVQHLRKVFGEVAQALREGFPLYMTKQFQERAIGYVRRDAMHDALAEQGYPVKGKNLYFHIEKASSRPKNDIALLYIAATARILDLSPAKMDLMLRAYSHPETVREEEVAVVRQGEELPELDDKEYEKMLVWIRTHVTTPDIARQIVLKK